MNCNVAILAGGMGTRLRGRVGDLPKPLAPIIDKPVLEYQLELCKSYGFHRIALLVHYQSEKIQTYFGDGSKWGVQLTYIIETEARGTAGALRDALDHLEDQFFVFYADTYLDINLMQMWAESKKSKGIGTIFLHPNDHPYDSDLVEVNNDGYVAAIRPYPHPEGACYSNLVNAALYVLRKAPLYQLIPEHGKYDLAKHTFSAALNDGLMLKAYISPEYIKDMGTPDRLDKVERDILQGLPEKLSTRTLRRAVFLDRDGTLNEEVNHLSSPEQLVLLSGVCDAIHQLNRAGILAICVTNQPVVARGDVSFDELRMIHAKLDHLLGLGHAYLDRLYFCPHHPDNGFEGEITTLKVLCSCRKPNTGLIDQAVNELAIDRRFSWMIGDTSGDVVAGQRACVRTILLRTGYAGRDYKYAVQPDYICDDLSSAIRWILLGHEQMTRQLIPIAIDAQNERFLLVGGPARSGKSMAAQVLKEIFSFMGKTVHVISLDSWLKDPVVRIEGQGILSRYDLANAMSQLRLLKDSTQRIKLDIPLWDRKLRMKRASQRFCIGPDDLIVIEGVPSLLHEELRKLALCSIYVDVPVSLRHQRLYWEYRWRGLDDSAIEHLIESREKDEIPYVLKSKSYARYTVFME